MELNEIDKIFRMQRNKQLYSDKYKSPQLPESYFDNIKQIEQMMLQNKKPIQQQTITNTLHY